MLEWKPGVSQEVKDWFEEAFKSGVIYHEIFSHVDPKTKEIRHFDATAMFRDAISRYQKTGELIAEPRIVALDRNLYNDVLSRAGIEEWKVDRLCEPYISWPIIIAKFPNTELPVDGNHRIIRRFRMGLTTVDSLWFEPEVWKRYLIQMPKELDLETINEVLNGQTHQKK